MSTEDNKALTRRLIEEVWNQGNLALIDELYATTFSHHDPDFPTFQTREGYKQWLSEARTAFPDLHLTFDEMIAEGEYVAGRWTFRGTNTGDMETPMHIPATGRQVTITGITISRVATGKVVEDWHQGDMMGFMQQLGLIPVPAQAS
jgi:steroid delta-isomerase-like uncharacterized protein